MASRFVFTPEGAQFPASNWAQYTKDAQGRGTILFDATSVEHAQWTSIAPQNLSLDGNCAVVINFYMLSATTGNVNWTANIEVPVINSEDLDAPGGSLWANGSNTLVIVPASTAGRYAQAIVNLTPSMVDSMAAGSYFRLRVTREASNTFDTATGYAAIVAVEFRDAA